MFHLNENVGVTIGFSRKYVVDPLLAINYKRYVYSKHGTMVKIRCCTIWQMTICKHGVRSCASDGNRRSSIHHSS